MRLNLNSPSIPYEFVDKDIAALKSLLASPIIQAFIKSKIHMRLINLLDGNTTETLELNLAYQRGYVEGLRSLVVPVVTHKGE